MSSQKLRQGKRNAPGYKGRKPYKKPHDPKPRKRIQARRTIRQNTVGPNGLLLPIGHGSYAAAGKLIAVLNPDSSPTKRLIHDARKAKALKDATHGRRARSILIMENGDVILSAVNPGTMAQRFDR